MRRIIGAVAAAALLGIGGCEEAERPPAAEPDTGPSAASPPAVTGSPRVHTGQAEAVETAGAPEPDDRERVALPLDARPAVRGGMLTMLRSLENATAALAAGDREEAARAAAESGMGNAAMMPVSVRRTAPGEFLTLGMSSHQAFDALAGMATEGAPADSLLAGLSGVLDACSACHRHYRVDWRHASELRD